MADDKQQVMAYLMVPLVMAASPLVGWFIGRWLDQRLGTSPYLMYTFLIFGFLAGFREVYRLIKRFGDDSK
jgi:F0F1-type ATP synthase assembly protein I